MEDRSIIPDGVTEKVMLVASNNAHKRDEFAAILAPYGIRVLVPRDLNLEIEVEETGRSFAENARLKAEAFRDASGLLAASDDSGLVVDALGGEPGIYSARFGGPGLDDAGRVRLLLDRMSDIPDGQRSARFVSAIAVAAPGKQTVVFEGTAEGWITRSPRGGNGFGYDPVFYSPELHKTFAVASGEEKASVSHRGRALRLAAGYLGRQ